MHGNRLRDARKSIGASLRRLLQQLISHAKYLAVALVVFWFEVVIPYAGAATPGDVAHPQFPPALESYNDADFASVWGVLQHRIQQEPLNLWVTLLFLCAIIHTFFSRGEAHMFPDRLLA